jgi:hypothetical protein
MLLSKKANTTIASHLASAMTLPLPVISGWNFHCSAGKVERTYRTTNQVPFPSYPFARESQQPYSICSSAFGRPPGVRSNRVQSGSTVPMWRMS